MSECLTANIFWLKEDILYTPSLTTGCIAGIGRKNILKLCAVESVSVAEGLFQLADLPAAEVVFTSNVTGLRAIQSIGQTKFTTSHPLIHTFNTLLFAE